MLRVLFILVCIPLFNDLYACEPISMPVTVKTIKKTIVDCNIDNIEDLLWRLPKELKENYVLIYSSRALGEGHPMAPRVSLFSPDGKITISFSGRKDLAGFDALETMQFNPDTQQFDFDVIKFPKLRNYYYGSENYDFSTPTNTPLCLACHINNKPIWDAGVYFPGVYGSHNDHSVDIEEKWLDDFKRSVLFKSGRYKYLLPNKHKNPNKHYGFLIAKLFAKKHSKDLLTAIALKDKRFLMAFASASLCDVDFESRATEVIPSNVIDNFSITFSNFYKQEYYSYLLRTQDKSQRYCKELKRFAQNDKISCTPMEPILTEKQIVRTSQIRWILHHLNLTHHNDGLEFIRSSNFIYGDNETYYLGIEYSLLDYISLPKWSSLHQSFDRGEFNAQRDCPLLIEESLRAFSL